MASITSLKAVRTRYRNILYTELKDAKELVSSDLLQFDSAEFTLKANKSSKLLKSYCVKLDGEMRKLSEAVGDKDDEFILKIVDEDCSIIKEVESCYIELDQAVESINSNKNKEMYAEEQKSSKQIVQLQQQMHDLMYTQMQHQMELAKQQKEKEYLLQNSVKLPKLELSTFNGNKLKWAQFWDAFESTVHKNRKLSNIEKFNYLQSKMVGEAKQSIAGLALSSDNYDIAVTILKRRFGNKQEIVDLHYSKLINIPAPSVNVDSLRAFFDDVEMHLRSLQVLEEDIDQHVFISMIRSKLPVEVLKQLEFNNGAHNEWTLQKLRDNLHDYIAACTRSEKKKPSSNEEKGHGHHTNQKTNDNFRERRSSYEKVKDLAKTRTAESLVVTNTKEKTTRYLNKKCRYCSGSHWSDECLKCKTIQQRKQKLKDSCYKCLKEGHKSKDCKGQKWCVYCGQFNIHHRSLCPTKFNNETTVHLIEEISTPLPEEQAQGQALVSSDEMVLMQTAKAEVKNTKNSKCDTVRILLDSGSQRSYITEHLASKLGLKGEGEEELRLVTFGSDKMKVIKTKFTTLEVKLINGSYLTINANIVPTISGSIQRNPVSKHLFERIEHLVNSVYLADTIPTQKESSTVEFLIGNDYYLEIILSQRIQLDPGLYLLSSKFGWILTGRTYEIEKGLEESSMLILTHGSSLIRNTSSVFTSVDKVIQKQPDLEDFWNVETIGIKDDYISSNDEIAMQKFRNTLKFEDGRYQVKWPWRDEMFNLPMNKQLALGRLKSTISRMTNKPVLMEKYNGVIEEQLKKGIIEKVNSNVHDGIKHYIPHHAVITPNKTTTKVRIVYDASAKMKKENNSLNECLYRGPVILQDLCGMLMRFRLHNIALVSDIEKAFLQIGLQPDQRDVIRFLWVRDHKNQNITPDNIQEFRFRRVPFGVISSPFLLGATVHCHLDTFNSELASTIKNDIYVDNLISGAHTVSEAIDFYNGAKSMFKTASMNLREWMSNSDKVNAHIPMQDKAEAGPTTVLGLNWDPTRDVISLKDFSMKSTEKEITKRNTLQEIASQFDPLGLFSPVTLNGKLFIQQLWIRKLNWDDELLSEDQNAWDKIRKELYKLHKCTLKRCVAINCATDEVKYNLVCFCDASEKAYACAVYLRQSSDRIIKVDLIFAKTRLSPVKTMTIPKLELMAVLIGVRCMKYVRENLRLRIVHTYLFTDSQCVIKWILTKKDVPVFVRNRVREIKQFEDLDIRYIKSEENSADIATRGSSVEHLMVNKLWWNGPHWLDSQEKSWPINKQQLKDELYTDEMSDVETKRESNSDKNELKEITNPDNNKELVLTVSEKKDCLKAPFEIDHSLFSSLTKVIRVTAYVLLFVKKLQQRVPHKCSALSSRELQEAENMWILYIQRKHYMDIITSIEHKKRNNIQRQLNVYLDQRGILRCRGRLQNADLTEGSKCPILLPKCDKFTHLLIEKYHKQSLHCGVSQTLSQVRLKYWIPRGRAAVKSVLTRCLVCRRCEGGCYKMPLMPPLPSSRVLESPPFSRTGLDYLGPLYVKTFGEDNKKVWVCLFTCLVTRGIHLELIQDMSAEEFIYALRRFVSVRGTPIQIYSDNASQFKTSSSVVHSIWKRMIRNDDVLTFTLNLKIQWTFIVELAPWMGGFYERLVSLVKRSLRKTLGRKLLTLIQLQTLLKEIETVINTRPLVYVGDDVNSYITLTPNHFLSLNPKVTIPDLDDDDDDPNFKPIESSADKLLKLWRKGQALLKQFWKIWKNDYLLSLRERPCTSLKEGKVRSAFDPSIGDTVLIKEDLPRSCWKQGIICNLGKSSDGNIRSAEVKLSTGRQIRRPLNLLFPIETSEQEQKGVKDTLVRETSLKRPIRKAAEKSREKLKKQLS